MKTDDESSREDLAARRRREILESAERLIAERGVDALRLRDVAAGAGVSIGMLQHYFASRDDLARETVRAANARRVAEWSMLADTASGPRARLTALLEGAIADRRRCLVWIETCAAASRHPELRSDVERTQATWRATLAELIDDGVALGELRTALPTEDVVQLMIALIDGLMLDAATTSPSGAADSDRVRLLRQSATRLVGAADEPGTP